MRILRDMEVEEVSGGIIPILVFVGGVGVAVAVTHYLSKDDAPSPTSGGGGR